MARLIRSLNCVLFCLLVVGGVRLITNYQSMITYYRSIPYVLETFHKLYYASDHTWVTTHWLNIQTEQNPNDVWITEEIISETKPDLIIEAGTFYGGSALIWAMVQDQVNPSGSVVTIDIQNMSDEAKQLPIAHKIKFLIGSSTAPEIVDQIKQLAGLRDAGAITVQEFEAKKAELLKRI